MTLFRIIESNCSHFRRFIAYLSFWSQTAFAIVNVSAHSFRYIRRFVSVLVHIFSIHLKCATNITCSELIYIIIVEPIWWQRSCFEYFTTSYPVQSQNSRIISLILLFYTENHDSVAEIQCIFILCVIRVI